ncbi:hypothetical protein PENTCL1PPCAC_25871, partial [Pristionchus entomophagus]
VCWKVRQLYDCFATAAAVERSCGVPLPSANVSQLKMEEKRDDDEVRMETPIEQEKEGKDGTSEITSQLTDLLRNMQTRRQDQMGSKQRGRLVSLWWWID